MITRTAKDAAANVPKMVEEAILGRCTTITRNGDSKAVVVPVGFYERAVASLSDELREGHVEKCPVCGDVVQIHEFGNPAAYFSDHPMVGPICDASGHAWPLSISTSFPSRTILERRNEDSKDD